MIFALWMACTPDPVDQGITYYKDVRPILDKNCVRCHTDNGISTSFDDHAVALTFAETMKAYTESGYMPPPAPDPSCREYEDSETYFLNDEDKATIAAWADLGAPEGDPIDAPPAPIRPTIAPYDLEMYATTPFVPTFDDEGNDYRCFQLDLGNDEAIYVTGFEALVNNPKIVHHVVLFDSNGRSLGDDSGGDPKEGFDCGGFGEDGWDFVTGWAPGGGPVTFPEGMGYKLAKETQLVLQMHYFDSFDGANLEQDQSGYALTYTDDADRRVYQFPLGTYDFTIPAGDSDYESVLVLPWEYGAYDILGAFPHMHTRGSSFRYDLVHADATDTCLVKMTDWDFHNQVTALFDEPAPLVDGDAISLTCTWNNSGNPDDVVWGEGTQDEMCFGFTYAAKAE